MRSAGGRGESVGGIASVSVVLVGLEHERVPLDVLERAAIPDEQVPKVLRELAHDPNVSELVVLSTCLRTECYAVVERFHEGVERLSAFLLGLVESGPPPQPPAAPGGSAAGPEGFGAGRSLQPDGDQLASLPVWPADDQRLDTGRAQAAGEPSHDDERAPGSWQRGAEARHAAEGRERTPPAAPAAPSERSASQDLPVVEFDERLLVAFDGAVVRHLFEVAAGLRSAVLGETEVLGQVRRAFETAVREGAAGASLQAIFQAALQAGRRVRAETAIAKGPTSMSHAAVQLALEAMASGEDRRTARRARQAKPASPTHRALGGRSVVVVGAGEVAEGVLGALAKAADGPSSLVVVNRTAARARALARRHGGKGMDLERLDEALVGADMVFFATARLPTSPPLLDESRAAALCSARAGRASGPLVVVDLGVPRNVSFAVRRLDGIVLVDVEDVRARTLATHELRRAELERAHAILDEELTRFGHGLRERSSAPIVGALRARGEEVRRRELERFWRRFVPDRDGHVVGIGFADLDMLTRSIVSKLLHEPTRVMKDQAGTPRGERLAEALRALFDL
jgi:glutamyl-tRNA reductase